MIVKAQRLSLALVPRPGRLGFAPFDTMPYILYIYMYMYIYVHIYIYTYLYIFIHTHIYTHT